MTFVTLVVEVRAGLNTARRRTTMAKIEVSIDIQGYETEEYIEDLEFIYEEYVAPPVDISKVINDAMEAAKVNWPDAHSYELPLNTNQCL
jgi:hypothetical protein